MGHDNRSAWALFQALRASPPSRWNAERVMHYEVVVGGLESAYGVNLSSFRVPSSELRPRISSMRMGTRRFPGTVKYTEERYARSEDMVRRLDGLALYLDAMANEKTGKPPVGFQLP